MFCVKSQAVLLKNANKTTVVPQHGSTNYTGQQIKKERKKRKEKSI
jgi:hypothetical protein